METETPDKGVESPVLEENKDTRRESNKHITKHDNKNKSVFSWHISLEGHSR